VVLKGHCSTTFTCMLVEVEVEVAVRFREGISMKSKHIHKQNFFKTVSTKCHPRTKTTFHYEMIVDHCM